MTKTGLVALVAALPVLACRSPQGAGSHASSDSTAVMTAYERYRQAWLRGDTAAALGLISDSIRILISGVPDIVGKDATRRLFADEMAKYDVPLLRLNHQDVIMSGDHVIVDGTYEEIQMPKRGAPIRGIGRYMTIWRREAGNWRIMRYMLNDLPPEKSRR